MESTNYEQLDLGTGKPTSVPMEKIDVVMDPDEILGNYAKGFVNEANRVNPLRAEQVGLTEDEVKTYSAFLLQRRIQCVHNECKDYRKLKILRIPSFIQYVLSMVGEVVDRTHGLKFNPVFEGDVISLDEAYAISDKIRAFEGDLQIVVDAMPRSVEGNPDVMSCALIAGYVRSTEPVGHPAATYVAAFVNATLQKEAAFQALYRVQYDDVSFIQEALTQAKGLF